MALILQNSYLDEKIGIVVFCNWNGTIDKIEEWANEHTGIFDVFVRGLDKTEDNISYLHQNENSENQDKHRKKQRKILKKLIRVLKTYGNLKAG